VQRFVGAFSLLKYTCVVADAADRSDPTLSANVLAAHSYGTVIALKFLSSLQSGNLEGADQSGEREENGPEYFKSAVLIGASAERPAGSSHPIWHAPFFGVAGHLWNIRGDHP